MLLKHLQPNRLDLQNLAQDQEWVVIVYQLIQYFKLDSKNKTSAKFIDLARKVNLDVSKWIKKKYLTI